MSRVSCMHVKKYKIELVHAVTYFKYISICVNLSTLEHEEWYAPIESIHNSSETWYL